MSGPSKRVLSLVVARKLLYGQETTTSDITFLNELTASNYLESLASRGYLTFRRDPGYVDEYGKHLTSDETLYSPLLPGVEALWA